MIAPPYYVAAPPVAPHRFGLYSAATVREDAQERFQVGVEWEPTRQTAARAASHECLDDYSAGYPLVLDGGVGLVTVTPFVVYGTYSCPAASRPIADARGRAEAALLNGEERAVEREIADGAVGASPAFADADNLTPAGGAVSLCDGLGILERALGELSVGVGVVHAPRLLAPHLSRDGIVTRQGQHLETMVGTHVVTGAGYDAAVQGGPSALPDGEAWLVATGRPQVWRGPTMTTPQDDLQVQRDTNMLEIVAQRAVAVGWSGPTVAVRVEAPEVE